MPKTWGRLEMKLIYTHLLIVFFSTIICTEAVALDRKDAIILLSSKQYLIEPYGLNKDYSLKIIKAQNLLLSKNYQQSFFELQKLDESPNNSEGTNIHLIPDLAIIAKAANLETEYQYYRKLSLDIATFYFSDATCVDANNNYSIIKIGKIHFKEELENRLCSAFTLDKDQPTMMYKWKLELLRVDD
jgi:hypothetical protein